MKFRPGQCSSCNAKYRVPASFSADKAKCKSCGGVVEIGPVQDDGDAAESAGQPVPAKKPSPAPTPPPAKKPAPPAKKPAPAAKPATPAPKPAARPAAKAPAKPAPKKAAASKSLGRKPASDGKRGAAPAGARRGSGASVREAAEGAAGRVKSRAGSGSSRRKPSSSSRRSKRPSDKKKNTPALIGGLLLVLIIGAGGAWYFLDQKDDGATQAAESETVASVGAEAAAGLDDETTGSEDADEATGAEDADAATTDDEPEEEAPKPKPKKSGDPDSVDLSALPDLERVPGTTDEEWTEMKQWMATFVDPAAGAAGNRARKKLLDAGRKAMPVVINAFTNVDVSTEDGYRTGDITQRLLQDICRGNNFDWKYSTEPGDVYFNKRVIEVWHKSFSQTLDPENGLKAWKKLGKLTDEEYEELLAAEGGAAAEDSTGIDLDDLDDF